MGCSNLARGFLLLLAFNIIAACPGQHHPHHQHNHTETHSAVAVLFNQDNNLVDDDEMLKNAGSTAPSVDRKNLGLETTTTKMNTTRSENDTHYVECACALFSVQSPIETDAPLISRTIQNVSCSGHATGNDACTELCITLAVSMYKEKDTLICSYVHNVTGLEGYLHSRMCNDHDSWMFTGMKSPKPLCCTDGKPVDCEKKQQPSNAVSRK